MSRASTCSTASSAANRRSPTSSRRVALAEVSLSAQHLVKRYGGVVALDDGSLDVESGEAVALMGANGSGKSTLGKIITGAVVPDSGRLLLDGEEVRFSSPQAARRAGISAVYQELSLVPGMTVAENIWLANEPVALGRVRRKERRERTTRLLSLFEDALGPSVGPDSLVSDLSPSDRQIVEILKALSREPRVMILDEATASLGARQVERLFELVGEWKARGMALIFISHRMEEIFQIADRATVLRSGRTVGAADLRETSEEELVGLIDRKSTRLNSSHANISYAVFCLKKKKSNTVISILTMHPMPPSRAMPHTTAPPRFSYITAQVHRATFHLAMVLHTGLRVQLTTLI